MGQSLYFAVLLGMLLFIAGELALLWRVVSRIQQVLDKYRATLSDDIVPQLKRLHVKFRAMHQAPPTGNDASFGEKPEEVSAPPVSAQSVPAELAKDISGAETFLRGEGQGADVAGPIERSQKIVGAAPVAQHDTEAVISALPVPAPQSGTQVNSGGQIVLLDPRTTGSRTDYAQLGYLEGTWINKKEFRVRKLNIIGELSRARVLELADRLRLRGAIQKELDRARNDDPIAVDFSCDLGFQAGAVVQTRIPGAQQEFVASLIPAVTMDPAELEMKIDDSSRPLQLRVRARRSQRSD